MNLLYHLAERGSPTKKFSDGVKALLARPWRKRKEQQHLRSHSKATSGSDQGAAAVQRNKAQSVGTAVQRQLVHLSETL